VVAEIVREAETVAAIAVVEADVRAAAEGVVAVAADVLAVVEADVLAAVGAAEAVTKWWAASFTRLRNSNRGTAERFCGPF
jgi:hypothetical protein